MNNRYKSQTDFFSIFNAITDVNGIQEKTLTQNQMAILMVILSNVNKESGEAFPTQENIRKRAGISSDTTYYKAFKPLVEKGWIIQRKRFNASTCYSIKIPDDIWNLLNTVSTEITVSTESVESVSTESVDTVSTESVELTTNNNNKYITTNIINTEKEKKEKDHNSFTNVQELGGLTTNDDSIESTIQNNKSIFNCEDEEPIFNYNTNEYENITDDNEQSYLSETELIERHGTDKEHINSNPYVKEYIIDTILDIIEYNKDQKHQDNLSKWIDNHNDNDFIYYIYRLVTEPQYKKEYDWIAVKQDKVKRLATIKSRLYADYQTFYNNNNQDEIEYIDESEVPEWIKYLRDYD